MRLLAAILAVLLTLSGCSPGEQEPDLTPYPGDEVTQGPEAATDKEAATEPGQEPETAMEPETEHEPEAEPETDKEPEMAMEAEPEAEPEPSDDAFVPVSEYLPGVYVDLKYSGEDNFTGCVIYSFTGAWLRYGTVKKLRLVCQELEEMGYTLLIWDAFRPTQAQFKLWEVCPDPTYVANPERGFSSHSRGNTVDVTLAYGDGTPLPMPTGFDDFSELADRDYGDVTDEDALENVRLLEDIMTAHGFRPYEGEWWHFSDEDQYPVEEDFVPEE